jgi:pyruvate formate lyase activating enzyme
MTAISLRNAFKTSSFFGSGQRQQGEVYQETEPMTQFKEVVVVFNRIHHASLIAAVMYAIAMRERGDNVTMVDIRGDFYLSGADQYVWIDTQVLGTNAEIPNVIRQGSVYINTEAVDMTDVFVDTPTEFLRPTVVDTVYDRLRTSGALSERPYFSGQGGLSVSGGEPGLQAKELLPLFREAKKRGFHTVLDTNASLSSAEYRRLLKIADLALIDLKKFDAESHLKLSGQDNEPVLKNILFREKAGKPFWIRYVLVPGWSDNREHLRQAAAFLAPCRHLERLEILPYHNLGVHKYKELGRRYRLSGVRPPSRAELEIALKIFRDAGLPVFIRA